MDSFYDSVYRNDNHEGEAYGRIQWKGTDVCVDLHCKCGHHGHYDGYFLYFYKCPSCKMKYALGHIVKLIPLDDEQATYVETTAIGFKTCDSDADP